MSRGVVLVVALALAGCGGATMDEPETASSAAAEAPRDEASRDLPNYLAELGITAAQREKLDGIRDRLIERLKVADTQRLTFQDAIVEAIAHCDPDYARMHIEGKRMITIGRDAQPIVLDAVNELHAMLTPEQRAKMVEPLIERNDERRGQDSDQGFKVLGEKLDLSVSQLLDLLARARTHLRLDRKARNELRDQFEHDAEAFKQPTFDAHKSQLGQLPITDMVVNLILDLGVVVLPVLDQRQCTVGADFAREQIAKAEAERAKRQREREARQNKKAP